MYERHIVIFGESLKSWALCLNAIDENRSAARNILVIDFSKLQSFRMRSRGRMRFQREYLSNLSVDILNISKVTFVSIHALFLAIFYCLKSPLRQVSRVGKSFLQDFQVEILKAALSQEFGTKFFDSSEVTKIKLIKYLHQIFSATLISRKLKISDRDLVSLFNGRFPLEATIAQCALNRGSKVEIYERASTQSKYEKYSTSPHFNPEWWEKIEKFSLLDELNQHDKSISNNTYIRNKVEGFDSFTGQKWFKPKEDGANKYLFPSEYIVFYATSTFEYSPIDNYNSRLGYSDMFQAITDLQSIAESLGYHLVIRRHPNSLSVKHRKDFEETAWNSFYSQNTTIVGPKDKIESHKLSRNARLCFVWRSSIGIETIYLGTPTFALGDARWAFMEECRAWSKDSIRERILNPTLLPFEKLSPYIGYMARGGTALKIVKSVNESFVTLHSGDKLHRYFSGELKATLRFLLSNGVYLR